MRRGLEPPALDLLEEAVQLLRRQRLSTLVVYYLGAMPFIVALWFFWSDMSRGSGAANRCAGEAFVVALAFLWMKAWQWVFVRRLRQALAATAAGLWTAADWLEAISLQLCVQPVRLVVLPVALVLTVPFGWALAFFESVTVMGTDRGVGLRSLCRRAWGQARLWPAQNHALLLVLALFALAVMVNVTFALGQVPTLLKSLLGIETVFSRSPWTMLNTTFLAVCGGLVFLAVDPVVKAVYVLRCFHGGSVSTGADLLAALRGLAVTPGRAALMLGLWLGACIPAAAEPVLVVANQAVVPVTARGPRLAPEELDRAIEAVLRKPEYQWRLPRERLPKTARKQGFLARALEAMGDWLREGGGMLGKWADRAGRWVGEFLEQLGRGIFGRGWRPPLPSGSGLDVVGALQLLLWMVLTVALALLAVLGVRAWQRHRGRTAGPEARAVPVLDLRSEAISATQLPEDEWLQMGDQLLQQGERRLALRAFYLAALSRLAQARLIRVARHKSNHEYEQEVRRRAVEHPEIHAAFAENVRLFDAVWYGLHEVTGPGLEQFQTNLRRIQTCDPGTSAA